MSRFYGALCVMFSSHVHPRVSNPKISADNNRLLAVRDYSINIHQTADVCVGLGLAVIGNNSQTWTSFPYTLRCELRCVAWRATGHFNGNDFHVWATPSYSSDYYLSPRNAAERNVQGGEIWKRRFIAAEDTSRYIAAYCCVVFRVSIYNCITTVDCSQAVMKIISFHSSTSHKACRGVLYERRTHIWRPLLLKNNSTYCVSARVKPVADVVAETATSIIDESCIVVGSQYCIIWLAMKNE